VLWSRRLRGRAGSARGSLMAAMMASPDGGQVAGPLPGPAGRGIFAERHVADMVGAPRWTSGSRTRRARSCAVACELVRLVTA